MRREGKGRDRVDGDRGEEGREGGRREEIEGGGERRRWMRLGGNGDGERRGTGESNTEGGTEVACVLEDILNLPPLTDITLCGVSRHQADCR